jgi:hypothetical protein
MSSLSSRASLRLLCRVLAEDRTARSQAIVELMKGNAGAGIAALASKENILPAFYDAISGFPDCLPKSDRVSLAMTYEANRRRNRQIRDAIFKIAETSTRQGISIAALKGARWIVEDQDDTAAWRSMIDVDLLVRPEAYDAMRKLLEETGYRAMRREQNIFGHMRFAGHYHMVALRRDDQPFATEMHRHVQWQPHLLPTEAVFASSREVAPGLWLPCPWHAAFHAIIHWQIHHYGYLMGFHRVTDGLDIARFLCRDDVDWRVLVDHAKRIGTVRAVEDALATVTDLFCVPLPEGFGVPARAQRYAAKALQMRDFRLSRWRAKQCQRLARLWHDYRYLYRSNLRKTGPVATRAGLWALRLRRLPFLISHLASIGVLSILVKLRVAFAPRLKAPSQVG